MGYWSIILPEAATNLITNPSFETNTTGWAASGTNTIASSTAEAKFGGYSLKATYQDNTTLATYAATLTASTTYYLSCYIYVPTNWDGGNIRLNSSDYASASATYNTIYTDGTSSKDRWLYIETRLEIDSDAVGSITIDTTSAPTAGRFIYIDAVQCEANSSYATTYIDGDQDGCKWTGSSHGSTSSRDAQSRAGGQVYDLDDFGFYVTELTGFGMANVEQQVQSRALIPGADYFGYKVPERQFALVGELEGSSWSNLHAKRQALIDAIKPDKVKGAQPFILRYTGADDERPLEITCVYLGGLEFGQHTGFGEKIGLRIAAYDPFFYEIGNDVQHFDPNDTATCSGLVAKIDGQWNNLGNPSGYTGYEGCILRDGDYIYYGGDFTNFDGDADADYIARYNLTTESWEALEAGLNGYVNCMARAPNGDIYFGGNFTDAGDADGDYLAYWDGTNINSVSGGGTGVVKDLAFDRSGNLYIVGDFDDWNAIANADNIVMWNGSAYSAVGTGANLLISDVAIHPFTGDIYVAGNFTSIGGVATDGIAYWDGTNWNACGTGLGGSALGVGLLFDKSKLYVAGNFTTFNGVTCNHVAIWNGVTAEPLGSGVDGTTPYATAWAKKNNIFYLAGWFEEAGGISLADVWAVWNGSTWAQLDINITTEASPPIVTNKGLIIDEDDLYLSIGFPSYSAQFSSYTTVTNNGTTKAYPKFVFHRSGGDDATVAMIKNEDTGDTLWLNYALMDGETLTLDLDPNNRTCISDISGDVWQAVLRGSDLTSFSFLPGDNHISIYIVEHGSPTTTCYATWRNTHWSSDGVA